MPEMTDNENNLQVSSVLPFKIVAVKDLFNTTVTSTRKQYFHFTGNKTGTKINANEMNYGCQTTHTPRTSSS
jgi:hypothetical protein